jgi:hypothetical protein
LPGRWRGWPGYTINEVSGLLDFAEERRAAMAEAYAYGASMVVTLKGEKAEGKQNGRSSLKLPSTDSSPSMQ